LRLIKRLFRNRIEEEGDLNSDVLPMFKELLPQQLGITQRVPELSALVNDLENALDPDWIEQIKRRALEEHLIEHAEFDWLFFELKRYFILHVLLKDVSIFNEEMENIWHEMLIHTREYKTFCKKFVGHFIHHHPNPDGFIQWTSEDKHKRALYDLIYSLLFQISPQNSEILTPFFQYKLQGDLLSTFDQSSREVLKKYFNPSTNSTVKAVQIRIIHMIQEKYRGINQLKKNEQGEKLRNAINQYQVEKQAPTHTLSLNRSKNEYDPAFGFLYVSTINHNLYLATEENQVQVHNHVSDMDATYDGNAIELGQDEATLSNNVNIASQLDFGLSEVSIDQEDSGFDWGSLMGIFTIFSNDDVSTNQEDSSFDWNSLIEFFSIFSNDE